jgi:hypothetical protein
VVAVICGADFPSPTLIGEVIAAGYDRDPETVWVVREKDKLARAALDELGFEYVAATLNPFYKVKDVMDKRGDVRDNEILRLCSRTIVFAAPQNKTLDAYRDELWANKVRVVERGKPKAKPRRKGKSLE